MRRSDTLLRFHRRAILWAMLACASLLAGPNAAQESSAAPGDRLVAVYQVRPLGDQGVSTGRQ
jgi:hypothetical protein